MIHINDTSTVFEVLFFTWIISSSLELLSSNITLTQTDPNGPFVLGSFFVSVRCYPRFHRHRERLINVRCYSNSGHSRLRLECPLCANSGHRREGSPKLLMGADCALLPKSTMADSGRS